MPRQTAIARARRDAREGKSPSTQAGEFIREEIHRIRHGEHGARSTKQAIAIGLSEARRAGVPLPPPAKGSVSVEVRHKAERDTIAKGKSGQKSSPNQSRTRPKALRKEGHGAVSRDALSRHAKPAARQRRPKARSLSAQEAAATRKRLVT